MNSVLEGKLKQLENAKDYECWYLVKQPTMFDNLCYLVSFLKKYKIEKPAINVENYITNCIKGLRIIKPDLKISDNYRALRVAAFFGLIKMTSSKYEEAAITDTYEEIYELCNGNFEETELYTNIIQRQIEKIYISSSIDEGNDNVRKNYRLFPLMLLYKVLLEIGLVSGEYLITMNEYRYLVSTTEKYSDFLNTLILIKLLREETTANMEFEKFRTKFDNRFIQALKQLPTLVIESDKIYLNSEKIEEVKNTIFLFEKNDLEYDATTYLDFLGSTKSIVDLDKQKRNSNVEDSNFQVGFNKIYYGIPGCGKSYHVENEVLKDADKQNNVFRTTFYLDYSNSDFIGQILPYVDGDKVSYNYTPGPFTKALERALMAPKEKVYLVIEELNRGNAAAIFGDVFQLLDRKDGVSEYPISNSFIENYFEQEKKKGKDISYVKENIVIPSNLFIIATMNTSDQNVFPLDTAFKRRWEMERVVPVWEKCGFRNKFISGTKITWKNFAKAVNNTMDEQSSNGITLEDKQLGPWFADDSMFEENAMSNESENAIDKFINKVMDYLWSDVTKFDRYTWFEDDVKSFNQLSNKIKEYVESQENDGKYNFCFKEISFEDSGDDK